MGNRIVFAVLMLAVIAGLLFVVFFTPGKSSSVQEELQIGTTVGKRAPSWELKDAEGNTHKLSDYLGQVVVMDFWATWCGPCHKVMPDLQKLHENYESRGVRVIGMNGSEKGGNPVQFMRNNNYTYGMMLNSEKIMGSYRVQGIPAIFVVGVDGSIIYTHVGTSPTLYNDLSKLIETHLQEHNL